MPTLNDVYRKMRVMLCYAMRFRQYADAVCAIRHADIRQQRRASDVDAMYDAMIRAHARCGCRCAI